MRTLSSAQTNQRKEGRKEGGQDTEETLHTGVLLFLPLPASVAMPRRDAASAAPFF